MSELAGKVALVTGAARGIGAACATSLLRRGARVILTDCLVDEGRATAEALSNAGYSAMFHPHDVSDPDSWQTLFESIDFEVGRLNILVNNAGVNLSKSIEELTVDEFRRVLQVNLLGCFMGMQGAIPRMRKSGGGAMVNVASNSTQAVVPLTAAYSPSKAAIANLTKVVAVHCAQAGYGIRVNSVHPGPIDTHMLSGGAERAVDLPMVRQLVGAIPMGRMGRPEEIGEVVAFLSGDGASFVTGAEFFVDGGLTITMAK